MALKAHLAFVLDRALCGVKPNERGQKKHNGQPLSPLNRVTRKGDKEKYALPGPWPSPWSSKLLSRSAVVAKGNEWLAPAGTAVCLGMALRIIKLCAPSSVCFAP